MKILRLLISLTRPHRRIIGRLRSTRTTRQLIAIVRRLFKILLKDPLHGARRAVTTPQKVQIPSVILSILRRLIHPFKMATTTGSHLMKLLTIATPQRSPFFKHRMRILIPSRETLTRHAVRRQLPVYLATLIRPASLAIHSHPRKLRPTITKIHTNFRSFYRKYQILLRKILMK